MTNNFNQKKKISNKSNLNINIFNSPKILKTILDDFRSNNSRRANFLKYGDKQKSIEIINFNLKEISKIKNNENTDRNYRNIDSTENIKKSLILENDEKNVFDKDKLKEKYSDVKVFNYTDKLINENKMHERNAINKDKTIKNTTENEQTIIEKKIGKTLNINNKTPNGYIRKKNDFFNENRVSKKKSYSYDFSRKYNKKFVETNTNIISDNQNKNNTVCKKKNGNDSTSYNQLFNLFQACNCFKKQKREKDITNSNDRSKSKEQNLNMNVIFILFFYLNFLKLKRKKEYFFVILFEFILE